MTGRNEPDARFRCVELKTGKLMWDRDECWRRCTRQPVAYGRGAAILADGKLIVLGEGGMLGLFAADPTRRGVGPFAGAGARVSLLDGARAQSRKTLSAQRGPADLPEAGGRMIDRCPLASTAVPRDQTASLVPSANTVTCV